jgi:hypothetical protein
MSKRWHSVTPPSVFARNSKYGEKNGKEQLTK